MPNLEALVTQVVVDLMNSETLFTALDVSNEVKKTDPTVRHKDVRDVVREAYTTSMTNYSYSKTPIKVTLEDGSNVDAVLYHPLKDSWDLEAKYDASKRAQKALKPNVNTQVISSDPTQPVVNQFSKTLPGKSTSNVVSNSPRLLWQGLFASQKSLFPRQ